MGMSASQARLLSLTARLSDLEFQAQSVSNSKIRLADESEEASREYSAALDKQKFRVLTGADASGNTYVDASAYNLTTYGAVSATDKQRFIKDTSGKLLVTDEVAAAFDGTGQQSSLANFLSSLNIITNTNDPDYDASKVTYYTNIYNEILKSGGYNAPGNDNMRNPEWLEANVKAGNIFLYEIEMRNGQPVINEDGSLKLDNVSWTSGDDSIQEVDDKSVLAKAEARYDVTMADIQSKDKRFDLQLQEINTEHEAIQTEIDSVKKVIDKNIERSFKTFSA